MDTALEVVNLSKKFKNSKFFLDNISFYLPKGSIMGLIGENGSGKTTTIDCILNLKKRSSGLIKLLGEELTEENLNLKEEIGVVFDGNNFSEILTTLQLDKVMEKLYKNWDSTLYFDYLKKFKLLENQKIKSFSKGMKVKLAIAVALSHNPKLLILDEPTSGLDPVIREDILDIFLEFVQDEEHSILISSHITTDLEKIADYITFIHEGKTVMSIKKDELIYDYGIMRCSVKEFAKVDKKDIISIRRRDYQIDVLVKNIKKVKEKYKEITVDSAPIDEIMLMIIRGEKV